LDKIDTYVLDLFKRYLAWIKSNKLNDTIHTFMFYVENIEEVGGNIKS